MMDVVENERFDELCWKYVEDEMSQAELAEFEKKMKEDEGARARYVRVAELHEDLGYFFTHSRDTGENPFQFSEQLAKRGDDAGEDEGLDRLAG